MFTFLTGQREEWPPTTTELCRWCMHRFDTTPVGIPQKWDERSRRVIMHGYFCSFSCAKTYTIRDCSSVANINTLTLNSLNTIAKRAYNIEHITPAPPREYLNNHTIEEFRAVGRDQTHYVHYIPSTFLRGVEQLTLRETKELTPSNMHSAMSRISVPAHPRPKKRSGGGIMSLLNGKKK